MLYILLERTISRWSHVLGLKRLYVAKQGHMLIKGMKVEIVCSIDARTTKVGRAQELLLVRRVRWCWCVMVENFTGYTLVT